MFDSRRHAANNATRNGEVTPASEARRRHTFRLSSNVPSSEEPRHEEEENTPRILRQSDGAYYTTPPAAALVAAIAMRPRRDDPRPGIQVVDPACGAGALLAACGRILQAMPPELPGTREPHGIAGFDIDSAALAEAAVQVGSIAPSIRREWRLCPHGENGPSAAAGALELLASSLWSAPSESRGRYDVVVMNPPFTRNEVRSGKFKTGTRDAMRQRERAIREGLWIRDPAAAAAVNPNSIQTFFVVLADFLASPAHGRVVLIIPTTAATSAGVRAQRIFLAERFVIELVVTSHDRDSPAFSTDSGVFETIVSCRRRRPGEAAAPTSFIALRRAPRTVDEGEALAGRIARRQDGPHESVTTWPSDRIARGDWTPCQWYDSRLASVGRMLEAHPALESLAKHASLGPKEGNVRHSWIRASAERARDDPHARQIVGRVGGPDQRTLRSSATQWMVPGNSRAHLWNRFDTQSSRLLIAERHDLLRGALTAMWLPQPTFGLGWRPLLVNDAETIFTTLLWWNTTAGRILLLSRRGKALTYPKWSTQHLLSMPVPRVVPPTRRNDFRKMFERLQSSPLRPLRDRAADATGLALDQGFVELLGITEQDSAAWRERIAAEPTLQPR